MKKRYFDPSRSAAARLGCRPTAVMEAVALRYIGANPKVPFALRAFCRNGFRWAENGDLLVDLEEKLPDAALGAAAFAAARLWSESEQEMMFRIRCLGPTQVYVNRTQVFCSRIEHEIDPEFAAVFSVRLLPGWNDFVLRCVKTVAGFGCAFALDNARWTWRNFLAPFAERAGMLSFAYSDADLDLGAPQWNLDVSEDQTGRKWYPELAVSGQSKWEACFGRPCGKTAFMRSAFYSDEGIYTLKCEDEKVWIDGKLAEQGTICLERGIHSFLVRSCCPEVGIWDDTVHLMNMHGAPVRMFLSPSVHGARAEAMFAGPFEPYAEPLPNQLLSDGSVFRTALGDDFWRLPGDGLCVRASFEEPLFGRWNYPVGVTLYGLLQAGQTLCSQEVSLYALSHIGQCLDYADYSVWELNTYGFPAVNNQWAKLEMLEDCGAFGIAVMEALKGLDSFQARKAICVADRIAMHIKNKQERKADGVLYRNRPGSISYNTIWADDLFMSTPFLTRYAIHSGCTEYMDDAAHQFFLFKKYLWIPEKRLMSHVYSFRQKKATGVIWGRGNGWVAFSLAEILSLMPEGHSYRRELMLLFLELSSGILSCQDQSGMWHQVLDVPESYEESSCTAMFIYALSIGVKNGWYGSESPIYRLAAQRGWCALCNRAIDENGNVYGVCQGSGYSFQKEYYMNELKPILNDAHGIGVVLLAAKAISCMEGQRGDL